MSEQKNEKRDPCSYDHKVAGVAVYIDGTETERGTELTGVERVELPRLSALYDWVIDISYMSIKFNTLAGAMPLLEGISEKRRLEVCAAVQSVNDEGEYIVDAHKHIMDVALESFTPSPLTRKRRTTVTASFRVRSYTAYVNGEKSPDIIKRYSRLDVPPIGEIGEDGEIVTPKAFTSETTTSETTTYGEWVTSILKKVWMKLRRKR